MIFDTDILVVGAGPTGLTMACELARRGVRCRVIDKLTEPSPLSKAIAVQARTLEIWHDLGVVDEALARGVKLTGVHLIADGKTVVAVSFDELETRYPYVLSLPQSDTEAILEARANLNGATVERGTELVSLTQDDDSVTATVRSSAGDSIIRARYLVGTDGAHSIVRHEIGLPLIGSSYEERFVLADVKIDWDVPRDRATAFFTADGLLACFPIPHGRVRFVATNVQRDAPTIPDLHSLVRRRTSIDANLSDLAWSTTFKLHCRQVGEYRVGRVFVAGDAAHIHSAVGGQGMNTGIQDAHNLAWKLALAIAGRASPTLLASYHAERHGVAADVLRSTDFATRVATLRSPVARSIRDAMSQVLTSLEVVQQRLTRQVAELTLDYAKSPIVSDDCSSVLASRLGNAEEEETPNLPAWRKFDLGPAAGSFAPGGTGCDLDGRAVALSSLVDGERHSVLLFDGQASTPEGYVHMAELGRDLLARYPDDVRVIIVVPGTRRPALLDWDGPLLFDPEGDLEERFGAAAECVYVVRPDLYLGFRGQPILRAPLFEYFERVFA